MPIKTIIENFSVTNIKDFFREEITTFKPDEENYEYLFDENENISENYEDIKKIGEADLTNSDDILVITAKSLSPITTRTGKKRQYEISKKILKEEDKDAAFFIFYDEHGNFRFSLIRVNFFGAKRDFTDFKRYTYFVSPKQTNKTFINQISKCDFNSLESIQKSFSIDAVTDYFYKEFKPNFNKLTASVSGEADPKIKQDFALLFIIRTIFLGFVQKKGWLKNDKEFLQNYWKEYSNKYNNQNLFYDEWLKPLFFSALNSPPGKKIFNNSTPFSKETELALQMAPFLNGELFKEKDEFDNIELSIPDEAIERFLEFLFSYNFTIEENTIYDQDLELNPEFLGIIFERLVNKEDGAVYTPRIEVDFMCRISLVKWLQKTSEVDKKKIYHLLFDVHTENNINTKLTDEEKSSILNLLKNITICDPAAGSGAFPVGMLQVLDEIICLISSYENNNTFERKKDIISRSLYGVEVKQWAVWINQLRLWLSLFIDMPDEFKNSFEPLLPNLDFKIRRGDSLVQRIGDKPFPIDSHATISPNIKRQITELKKEKVNFFYAKGRLNAKLIKQKETSIFIAIIDEQIDEKQKELNIFGRGSEGDENIFGEIDNREELRLQMDANKKERLIAEIEKLKNEKKSFKDEHPLVWNIEFAEIFYEKNGFDVIIGNPPYVQKEDIADPENKLKPSEYKENLRSSIYEEFPNYFYATKQKAKLVKKIDGKSDLYTFFYLKTLKLLNKNGVHTFICSNSWIDVGFGKWVQEFILENIPAHLIIDNQAKRSFASADVNTIISVFDAPVKIIDEKHKIKFAAFKKPFENVINTENLLLIDYAETIVKDEDFRVFPISYAELKEAGTVYENENDKKLGKGKYEGDKWGGKYLRAPDIYLQISSLQIMKKIIDFGNINLGLTSCQNDYFYLNSQKILEFNLPSQYLFPIFKSPQDSKIIFINPANLQKKVFICNEEVIKNESVKKYINYGIDINVNEVECLQSRKLWYSIGNPKKTKILIPYSYNDSFKVFYSETEIFCDKRLVMFNTTPEFDELSIALCISSSIWALITESNGSANMGQGALVFNTKDFRKFPFYYYTFNEQQKKMFMQSILVREINSIFIELGFDSEKPIRQQEPNPLPDRKELDNIIFDAIGLTEEERKEVYWATAELVQNRLNKAKSV